LGGGEHDGSVFFDDALEGSPNVFERNDDVPFVLGRAVRKVTKDHIDAFMRNFSIPAMQSPRWMASMSPSRFFGGDSPDSLASCRGMSFSESFARIRWLVQCGAVALKEQRGAKDESADGSYLLSATGRSVR
jgi:hypothetical protein